MRWIPFLLVVFAALLLQTTLVQALWLPTRFGWMGPELLAAMAVFVALNVRSGSDAALAGWTLGMAIDLTLSGEGMGLLSLLYAAAAAGVWQVRRSFFREKILSQAILALGFCLVVYGVWSLFELLVGAHPAGDYGDRAMQVLGLAVYTAVVAPVVYGLLRRMHKLLLAGPPPRERR